MPGLKLTCLPALPVSMCAAQLKKAWARTLLLSPHPRALSLSAGFSSTFSDSGHWDFAVLALFERFARTAVVLTIGPVTEAFVGERAAFAAEVLNRFGKSVSLFATLRGFGAVVSALNFLGAFLATAAAVASFGVYF